MGKRYYCDYCDRSFKDDVEARKKHLYGLQHTKNRADHYSAFKDPETILKEESGKIPCKRYMTVGDCAFGLGCRFSHYTPPMIFQLQRLVAMRNFKGTTAPKDGWPNPEDIVKEYFERVTDSRDAEELGYAARGATSSELADYSDLPPSLRPFAPESTADCDFSEWGRRTTNR